MPILSRALLRILPLLLALAAAPASAADPGDWRTLRWGMSPDEVVAALPKEAQKLESQVKLADGNVIAADAKDAQLAGYTFTVAFVFDPALKLTIVSLKSAPGRALKPEDFDKVRKAVAEQQGGAGELSKDDNFIDLRQETWRTKRTRVDVKYVPGVVVVMYSAAQPEVPPMLRRL